jgi:hypothetical protein
MAVTVPGGPQGTDDLNYYIEIANDMIERHEPLRAMQDKLDDMSHLKWQRPADLAAPWMRSLLVSRGRSGRHPSG